MAETTLTGTLARSFITPQSQEIGPTTVYAEYTQGGQSSTVSAVIQMCKLPPSARLISATLAGGPNNGDGCTLTVGNADDPSAYAAAISASIGMVETPLNKALGERTSNTAVVVIHINACASVTVSGVYKLQVTYLTDEEDLG